MSYFHILRQGLVSFLLLLLTANTVSALQRRALAPPLSTHLAGTNGEVRGFTKLSNASESFPDSLDPDNTFGEAVVLLEDRNGDGVRDLAVGAPRDENCAADNCGAVWILSLDSTSTIEPAPWIRITTGQGGFVGPVGQGDYFGASLASLGDLDGDGFEDLAVGAWGDDDGGSVWILFLNQNGTVKSEVKISATQGGFGGAVQAGDNFGFSLANLGDLDGDGVTDLAVGAPASDGLQINQGAVWILFLNADGSVKSESKISDTQGGFSGLLSLGDRFASGLAPLGDLDGDGVRDLAVGAQYDDDGGADRGAVWILFLDVDGSVKVHAKISDVSGGFLGALDDEDRFGVGLGALGDLDGDGVLDLGVGAIEDDDGGLDRGAAWILFLDTNGTVKGEQKISSTQGGLVGPLDRRDWFGRALSQAADLDGNGTLDLAVGASQDDDGGLHDRGAVYILSLETDGTVLEERKISDRAGNFAGTLDDGDNFATSVVAIGDLDGDGISELAVGAPYDDAGYSGPFVSPNRGAVWILFPEEDRSLKSDKTFKITEGLSTLR